MLKLTVLMPVYNGRRYLKNAIESVLNQTFGDFEFLIIDDKSTDGSKDIIASYKDKRIRFIENAKNLGQMATLNVGTGLAGGEYIARMDQDDTSLRDRFRKEVELLDKFEDAALVYSDSYIIDSDGRRRKKTFFDIARPRRHYVFDEMIKENFIVGNTVMMRKKIFDNIGLYNPAYRISAEYDLYLRLTQRSMVDFIGEPLAEYRAHGENSSANAEKATMEVISVLKNFNKSNLKRKQKLLMDEAMSRYTADLSTNYLFQGDRSFAKSKAREALVFHAANPKAFASLCMANFFPKPLLDSISHFRKGWLR